MPRSLARGNRSRLASISMLRAAQPVDVAIVGGGIIGLACAWRARGLGLSVTLLEREQLGGGTSHVAAGMLAPVAEVEFGDAGRRLLELGMRSAELWPEFARELEQASGMDVGLLRTGTLVVARDEDEARELERQLAFRDSLGLRAERLRPSEAREREPALAPTVRLALEAPDDHSVDPRLVLAALRTACERAGVAMREHAAVAALELDDAGGRVTGLRLAGGERIGAAAVVLAAGAWSSQVDGLPAHARIAVRPVKGQILRLRDPAGPGLLGRVLRFQGGYLVPRGDGRYVLGATVEERGFEFAPDGGRRVRAAARRHRAAARDRRAADRGALRGPAPRHARQRAGDRPGRRGGPRLGDRPPPQRHPARAAHRGARAGGARGGAGVIVNGEPRELPAGETVLVVLGSSASTSTRAGSRWRSTARWCRASVGRRSRWPRTRAWRCSRRCREDERVSATLDTRADPLTIAGVTLDSRLLLGTGGFPSLALMAEAIAASESELVTVALRRVGVAPATARRARAGRDP